MQVVSVSLLVVWLAMLEHVKYFNHDRIRNQSNGIAAAESRTLQPTQWRCNLWGFVLSELTFDHFDDCLSGALAVLGFGIAGDFALFQWIVPHV
jgi:hypothetical protein